MGFLFIIIKFIIMLNKTSVLVLSFLLADS